MRSHRIPFSAARTMYIHQSPTNKQTNTPACIETQGRVGGCNIPVLIHVKEFGADEESHVVHADCYQDFIACAVERFVFVAVDLKIRKQIFHQLAECFNLG